MNIFEFLVYFFTFHYDGVSFANPLLLPAILTGAGSVLGGIGNFLGISSSNKSNERAANAANALQYQMFQEGNAFNRQERLETQDWNRKMWYEQQRYNSPLAQAQRLSVAGLNPSAIMDGNAAATTGQIASSSPASSMGAPSMHVPTYQPPFNSEMITGPLNAIADVMLKKEQLRSNQINNESLAQKNILELQNLASDLKSKSENRKYSYAQRKNFNLEYKKKLVELKMLQFQQNRQSVEAGQTDEMFNKTMQKFMDEHDMHVASLEAQRMVNDIQRKYGLKMAESQYHRLLVEISEGQAHFKLLESQKGLTDAYIEHEAEKKAKTIAERVGLDNQNKHWDRIKDDVYLDIKDELLTNYQRRSLERTTIRNEQSYQNWFEWNRHYDSGFRYLDNLSRYLRSNLPNITPVFGKFK